MTDPLDAIVGRARMVLDSWDAVHAGRPETAAYPDVTRRERSHAQANIEAVEAVRAALSQAWREGHAAGRDYQGDGWNSYGYDPERDNPYAADEVRS